MEGRLLGSLGKIAGVAGIAFGFILLIFQGVLQKQFLPQAGLGQNQAFAIIFALLILSFGIAGIGIVGWLIDRRADQNVPLSVLSLAILSTLVALVLGAAVYVGLNVTPDSTPRIAPSNPPTATAIIPSPPAPPARPIADGIWDVTMSCPDTSALNEQGAQFYGSRYSRTFGSGSELGIGYVSDNVIKVTGYVVFGQSNVVSVDATGRKRNNSFSGEGRFGSSVHCNLTVISKH